MSFTLYSVMRWPDSVRLLCANAMWCVDLPADVAERGLGVGTGSWAYSRTGKKGRGGAFEDYGLPYTTGDVITLELDLDVGSLRCVACCASPCACIRCRQCRCFPPSLSVHTVTLVRSLLHPCERPPSLIRGAAAPRFSQVLEERRGPG